MSNNMIDEVIETLGAMYPSWRTASKDPDVRYHWGRAMSRAGITGEQIKQGVMRAERDTSSFPPSVGQFIEWCKPSGAATPEQAWHHIMTRNRDDQWLNEAIVEAVRRAGGSFYLKNGNDRYTRKLFTDHYQDVLSEQAQGVKFDLPSLPAPEPEETGKLADPDTAREYLDNARKAIQDSLNGQ